MKINIRFVLTVGALLMLAAPTVAVETQPGKINVSRLDPAVNPSGYDDKTAALLAEEDRQLAIQKVNFMKFAAAKIREMNRNHILSRARMQIKKGPDGSCRAFFHEIDDTSLDCEVSRSKSSSSVPYVAVLSYKEQVYAASCATPEDCRQSQFQPVEEIPNRHIFVYNNGSWQ